MCAHIFAYVRMEAMPTQEVTKKGNVFTGQKKNCIHVEGDSRASTPLPLYSIGRLIFYSGRSRICICSGVPFLSTLLLLHLSPSFSRDVCICLGHNTDDAAIGRAKSACISIQHACFNFDSRKPVFIFVYDLISTALCLLNCL